MGNNTQDIQMEYNSNSKEMQNKHEINATYRRITKEIQKVLQGKYERSTQDIHKKYESNT